MINVNVIIEDMRAELILAEIAAKEKDALLLRKARK